MTNKDDLKKGVGIALSVFNIGVNSATLERVDVIDYISVIILGPANYIVK